MSAGQFYLINAFRNEGNGASHMWVAVEVESKENNAISIVAVEKINITCDAIREIQEIKIYNFDKNNLFKIVLEARDPTTGYCFIFLLLFIIKIIKISIYYKESKFFTLRQRLYHMISQQEILEQE